MSVNSRSSERSPALPLTRCLAHSLVRLLACSPARSSVNTSLLPIAFALRPSVLRTLAPLETRKQIFFTKCLLIGSSLADTCEALHILRAYELQARIKHKAAMQRQNISRTFLGTLPANNRLSNVPASVRRHVIFNPLRTPKNFPEVLRSGLVPKLPLLTCLTLVRD